MRDYEFKSMKYGKVIIEMLSRWELKRRVYKGLDKNMNRKQRRNWIRQYAPNL